MTLKRLCTRTHPKEWHGMADNSLLPRLSHEQRRVAAGQFERANQVITTGNHDYGIQLLLTCCKLDPGSLIYRQKLRQTEKAKYQNNLRGSSLAFLSTIPAKMKLRKAVRQENHLKVLEVAEQILVRNPWDVPCQLALAESFEALELLDLAVWTLDQARQKGPNNPKVNRALARLYEKRGNFTQAMALWNLVKKAAPHDVEAQHKAKDLAASATIAKGRYEEAIQNLQTDDQGIGQVETATEQQALAQTQGSMTPAEERTSREANALRARIKADPTNPQTYVQLALMYRRADMNEQASEVLKEGLGPTGNDFELGLVLADLEIEPYRKNLALAQEKLRQQPDDTDLQKVHNRLIQEINVRELDLYRQKAERYPTEMGHRFEMGLRLLRCGQVDEAIKELQAARSDPRLHGRALVYLGYCFKSRNNWRLAQRNFEEAMQNLPASEESLRKEIMYQLAQGYADSGDLNRAIEQGYELANLDFSYHNIGRLIDEWQERLQKA
ncbi:MAG TPA: tetratricopeptide repeat protein [Gemmataceae bacterium]|nr:tetratricopeptide repeat protein [Gemmataceae bacterium]